MLPPNGNLQVYIEAENMRLERDPCQFSAKEIIVKIEYKYCPNLTIIDTPGLIAAPPSRKNQLLQVHPNEYAHFILYDIRVKKFVWMKIYRLGTSKGSRGIGSHQDAEQRVHYSMP